MASSLADNHGNSSMSLDRQILQVARHQHIYSHFTRCTWVPWHSLTSLVSFLALVNGIHQWSVIQWFLFMLDLNTFIRMTRIVPSSFVVGEDYTLFLMTPSAVVETWLHIYECTTVPLSTFHIFPLFISSSSYSSTSHYSGSNSYSHNNIYSYIFTLQSLHILHDSIVAVSIPSMPMIQQLQLQ